MAACPVPDDPPCKSLGYTDGPKIRDNSPSVYFYFRCSQSLFTANDKGASASDPIPAQLQEDLSKWLLQWTYEKWNKSEGNRIIRFVVIVEETKCCMASYELQVTQLQPQDPNSKPPPVYPSVMLVTIKGCFGEEDDHQLNYTELSEIYLDLLDKLTSSKDYNLRNTKILIDRVESISNDEKDIKDKLMQGEIIDSKTALKMELATAKQQVCRLESENRSLKSLAKNCSCSGQHEQQSQPLHDAGPINQQKPTQDKSLDESLTSSMTSQSSRGGRKKKKQAKKMTILKT